MADTIEPFVVKGSLTPIVVMGPKEICPPNKCKHFHTKGKKSSLKWPDYPTTEQTLKMVFHYHQSREFIQRAFPKHQLCLKYWAIEYSRVIGIMLEQTEAIRLTIEVARRRFSIPMSSEPENAASIIREIEEKGGRVNHIPDLAKPQREPQQVTKLREELEEASVRIRGLEKEIECLKRKQNDLNTKLNSRTFEVRSLERNYDLAKIDITDLRVEVGTNKEYKNNYESLMKRLPEIREEAVEEYKNSLKINKKRKHQNEEKQPEKRAMKSKRHNKDRAPSMEIEELFDDQQGKGDERTKDQMETTEDQPKTTGDQTKNTEDQPKTIGDQTKTTEEDGEGLICTVDPIDEPLTFYSFVE